MVHGKLPQPMLHIAERLAVRRQDQGVGMQDVEERPACLEKRANGVELRLDMPSAHVVVMLGQNLVAGNEIFRSAQ